MAYWTSTKKRDHYGKMVTIRSLTPEGETAWRQTGVMPPDEGSVRADADGLVMHEVLDDANRKIRTWTGNKRAWMSPYMSEPQLQLGINHNNLPKDQFERQCKQRWQEKVALADQIAKDGLGSVQTESIAHALAGAGEAAFVRSGGSVSK
jgi:hypothetical protein